VNLSDIQRKYDTVISLGGSCQVTYQMARHNLRTFSGPLDWFVFYSASCLSKALNSGFQGFMDYQNLEVIGPCEANYIIKDSVFDCYSYHDFPLCCNGDISSYYPEFKEKIDRRVQRFQQKLQVKKSILLIRLHGRFDDIRDLKTIIGGLTKSDVTLLLVNHSTVPTITEMDWNLPNVCSVEIYNSPNSWSGCDQYWDVLLNGVKTVDNLDSDYNVFYG
jgi:hypothetical protein